MTADQLAAFAGMLTSLLFSYVPGFKDWYGALDSVKKSLIMAGLMVVIAVAAFGLSCGNVWTAVTCDKAGVLGLISALIAALVANQATYVITRKTIAA